MADFTVGHFLLLYRQNMTFWSLLNAVFFRYCHHRCQAVLAGISTQNRPSGSPIPGVWRPASVLGEKIATEVWKIFRRDFVGSAGFQINAANHHRQGRKAQLPQHAKELPGLPLQSEMWSK
ncbi:hypothetical protein [Gemmiger sp.]|uniref:hypothetical protein n=1 Tax=Gemmiger sp. TaxID=2049027 RepID=UPI002A909928|nr:hypothetical protein [Gemmiger sp.]